MEQLRQISFAFFEAAQSQDKTHGRGRKKSMQAVLVLQTLVE